MIGLLVVFPAESVSVKPSWDYEKRARDYYESRPYGRFLVGARGHWQSLSRLSPLRVSILYAVGL